MTPNGHVLRVRNKVCGFKPLRFGDFPLARYNLTILSSQSVTSLSDPIHLADLKVVTIKLTEGVERRPVVGQGRNK